MKKTMVFVLLGGLALILTGCEKSAQEVAEEEQKAMLVAAEKDLAKAQADLKALPPIGTAKVIDWNAALHPNKK